MADEYKDLPLTALRLDALNPRLPRELTEEERTQPRLLLHFARRYNLLEIARSMADKGFVPRHAEALLVVEEPPKSGQYSVIEGNRRLATIILLTDEEERKRLRLPPEWEDLAAEAKSKGHSFDPVPTIIYDDRKDLAEYLGFRHITGPSEWRPEAKARFVAGLLADGRSISDVARRIGSNARTVRRYAEAHAVYEQALALDLDVEPIEAAFGVFYNALNFQGVRSYLDLSPPAQITGLPKDPVPESHLEQLRTLIGLLYGDKEAELDKVLGESRDLIKLSTVLLDKPATGILLESRDLDRAYGAAGGGKNDLMASLRDSFTRLIEANGQAYAFKDDIEVSAQVKKIVDVVADMAARYEIKTD